MTTYNETKPLAELIALKARIALMQDDFKDVDGNVIDIGYPVQYFNIPRESEFGRTLWNPERWGIVTALIKTPQFDYEKREESSTEFDVSIEVNRPNVISSRNDPSWNDDKFICDPKSVRVIQ